MATPAGGLNAAAGIINAYGQEQQGNLYLAQGHMEQQSDYEQAAAKDYESQVLTQKAGQQRGASERNASISRFQTDIAQQHAQAVAGASGVAGTSASVVNTQSKIAGIGRYNELMTLYQGEEAARGSENAAALRTYEGQELRTGGDFAATVGYEKRNLSDIAATSTILGSVADAVAV